MIQDKPKIWFGKWIHGVLAYIHFVYFEHRKVMDCRFNLFTTLNMFSLEGCMVDPTILNG